MLSRPTWLNPIVWKDANIDNICQLQKGIILCLTFVECLMGNDQRSVQVGSCVGEISIFGPLLSLAIRTLCGSFEGQQVGLMEKIVW